MMLEVTRALDGFLPYQRIYNFLITVLNLIEKVKVQSYLQPFI